jgi:hypothetical protein
MTALPSTMSTARIPSSSAFVVAFAAFSLLFAASMFGGLTADSPAFLRTHATAWSMTLLASVAMFRFVGRWRVKPLDDWWRWFWTFGWLTNIVHFYFGLFHLHGGNAVSVFERQGLGLALAIFFFTGLWGIDVVAAWLRPRWAPPYGWLDNITFAVAFATFFISTVVFNNDSASLVVGSIMILTVAAALVVRLAPRPQIWSAEGTRKTSAAPFVLFVFAVALATALLAPLAFGDVIYHRARFTIWAALTLASPAIALAVLRIGRAPLGAAWLAWWTAALAFYLLHIWYGFGVMFAGSWSATAEAQGPGVTVSNFALAALWSASVAAGWLQLGATWLHALATALLVVNATTSTLLFGRPPSPLIGGAFAAVIAAAALVRVALALDAPVHPKGTP